MSTLLDMFKIKPFDVQPVLATWKDGPKFSGNRKKDPPVALWLDQVRTGCVQRQVPEEYWHEVAEHFMGKKAKRRFTAVKKVLYEMNGQNYRWTWKKFKLLMSNVGWDIDPKARVAVEPKSSGTWRILGKKKAEGTPHSAKKHIRSKSQNDVPKIISPKPKPPTRSASSFLPWNQSNDTNNIKADIIKAAPTKPRFFRRPVQTEPESSATLTDAIVQAPLWLFMACDVLESLSQGYPNAMTALSAVLIIAGSIPAIPAVTTGAAGTLLASHAVQAAGAAAVSLGTWLRTKQTGDTKGSGSK
ncbi:hypothetical protein NEOLEDRAFT_1134333 [Neolentinus lepideus HHB14362 ss-1]|uniref:Uncharacterized protein n=1 Tax=Neolentinus lepideus HHB14362 ss-1 TaxID=1314782 RepID=A0A165SFX0_9AGAM|nr:hypothetical protein NEOLEDRAFT_1134333 [Neolentinus lepideus HHB14362 ss-1]